VVKRILLGWCICMATGLALSGCLPNIIIIDRPSVIEEESAGAWIEIEKELSLLHSRIEPVREVQRQDEKTEDALRVLPTGADHGAEASK
jgi:hypothetical protein